MKILVLNFKILDFQKNNFYNLPTQNNLQMFVILRILSKFELKMLIKKIVTMYF